MKLVTPHQIARVYSVTDSLDLNRNWVVITLAGTESPVERLLPDGKLFIRAPGGAAFETWFTSLRRRLLMLDLSRTPRTNQRDFPRVRIEPQALPSAGARKYLGSLQA